MLKRLLVHFSGRVQGVGFRYRTERLAARHDVSGYVRNLPDGRVELVAEGKEAEINSLVQAIEQAMSSNIHSRDVHTLPATGEFSDFVIRR